MRRMVKRETYKFIGAVPQYYHGETCDTYWLCYGGYQYPLLQCPKGLVFSRHLKGCTKPEFAICPGNEFDGHIKGKLIYPERNVHDTCGSRLKNGDYLIFDKNNFTTPEFCGYRQVECFISTQ